MTKILNIIKENYKLMIPITLMVVLFASFILYYKTVIISNYTKDEMVKVYQYFYDKKYSYSLKVTKNRKDEIQTITPQNIEVNFDSTPIYYSDKNITIFPKDMSVIMPTLNCSEYLAKGYSYIIYQNKLYNLITEKYNKPLNHYFLYDGKDLYYFIEPVTLKIDNQEIKLTKDSYVIANYKRYIAYYNKEKDEYQTIETSSDDALIENNYYSINISKDTINYQGTTLILTSNLENLITIDQKD